MSTKKYINLPRGYLSYSQVALWKANPERYKQTYFDGRTDLSIYNDSMGYGIDFANALEKEKDTGEEITDAAILLLKKYDVRDKAIYAEIKTKYGWLRVVAKPDTFNSETCEFREYKTGKSKWTLFKAQKHFQIKYYAMVIYFLYGKVLRDAYLDWVETHHTQDGIRPTGRIESFKVSIGLPVILETMKETIKVALEIESAWAIHKVKPLKPF